MSAPTDRPAVNNLFRPSLLAWRAKHRADKAAKAKPGAAPKPTEPVQTPPR